MVHTSCLYKYCNADPAYYKNVKQITPNSEIPDEDWYSISKETSNPWSQANKLKEWSDSDKQFIRNVKLEKMVTQPVWEEVEIK
jgi:hypothetical protein